MIQPNPELMAAIRTVNRNRTTPLESRITGKLLPFRPPIMKIEINKTKFMRGKGFEPLNSCENRS